MGGHRGARFWVIALGAVVSIALAAGSAQARAPVMAYKDAARHLQLYDAETGAPAPAPALTFNNRQIPFAVSFDGRYIAYIADGTGYHIHLFDRVANAEIALPGIDIYNSATDRPDDLTVSDTGLIGFDDNINGGVVVYNSATGAFVPTGLPPDSKNPSGTHPRQPVLSGDGRFLATTCITGATSTCPDTNLNGGHATLFLQDLTTKKDTGLPPIDPNADPNSGTDYEHPCLDSTGDIIGADASDPSPAHHDVYIYDRSKHANVNISGLNNPPNDTVRCSLSFGGRYVGVENNTGNVRLYDRNTGNQIPVSSTVIGPPVWFTAPFVPPNAPAVASPTNGATFTRHQLVKASYSCSDPDGGMGIASCTGPVQSGAPIDTSTPGIHTFTVTATDTNGLTNRTTITYSVAAPNAAPVVSHARLSHRRWRERKSHGNKRLPVGTTFFFTMNEPATVRFSFSQRLVGHKRPHSRCSQRIKHGRRCTLMAARGVLTVRGQMGANKLPFAGRLSRSRKLKPGTYAVTITAVNAVGQRSKPQTLTFTIAG